MCIGHPKTTKLALAPSPPRLSPQFNIYKIFVPPRDRPGEPGASPREKRAARAR